jgi:hypothetical protein
MNLAIPGIDANLGGEKDDFDRKYRAKVLSEAAMAEAMKEEMTLTLRSIWVAGFLAGDRWITDPSAAIFWKITGELRLLEIALRRRIWELGGVPLTLPLEVEIAMQQELIQDAKKRTERDVLTFWKSQKKSKT